MAYRVTNLLDWYAVAAHDRDCGVSALVSVPVATPAFLVIFEKRQLSASDVYMVPFSWQNTRLGVLWSANVPRLTRSADPGPEPGNFHHRRWWLC
jgi:hypothetical protein